MKISALSTLSFCLLLFSGCSGSRQFNLVSPPVVHAQSSTGTQMFSATTYGNGLINDPTATYQFGLWNPAGSGKIATVTDIEIYAGFEGSNNPSYVELGVSPMVAPSSACTNQNAQNWDLSSSIKSVALVTSAPCGSNGVRTTGLNIYQPLLTVSKPAFSTHTALVIPMNKGLSIFAGDAFTGSLSIVYQWKEDACGASGQPTC